VPSYDVLIYRDFDSNVSATEGARANAVIPDLPEDAVISGVYAPLHESKDATVVISGRVGLPEGLHALLKSRGPS
jgi:hypothetical protein